MTEVKRYPIDELESLDHQNATLASELRRAHVRIADLESGLRNLSVSPGCDEIARNFALRLLDGAGDQTPQQRKKLEGKP